MNDTTYNRFANTLPDLLDCRDALDNGILQRQNEMSASERKAMHALILVCADIADEYGEEAEDED